MNNWSWLNFTSRSLQLKKSDQLFAQGEQVHQMHIVLSGRVKLIRHLAEGEDVVLHVATAGEMIAEASFFSKIYHCSAVADQSSEIQCIDRDLALTKIFSDAHRSQQVMRLFAQQIRDLRGLHEIRNIRSAQARVLAYLTTQADKNGTVQLGMSLRDMAYKLGLAHETLYRELRKLEMKGEIKRPTAGEFIIKI